MKLPGSRTVFLFPNPRILPSRDIQQHLKTFMAITSQREDAGGTEWVKAMEVSTHPSRPRAIPRTKNYQYAEVE